MRTQQAKATGTKTNIQRTIRTAGTNRATGKADHLHRGDRRDMQDSVRQKNKGQDERLGMSPRSKVRGYRAAEAREKALHAQPAKKKSDKG